MTSHDLLAVLKFSLPAVAFASVILGQLKNVRREGADGDKHLTFYGRVLTGLTILSAFVSLFAAGLEAILKKQDEAETARKKQATDIADIRKAQDAQAKEAAQQAADQKFRDEEATRARDVQDRLLAQKLAFLKEAAAAQRRDALISHQLASASAARLADAERAIAEFARINYPLRKITATVAVDLALSGPEVARWWTWLVARSGVPFERGRHEVDPNRRVVLEPQDLQREDRVQYAAIGNAVTLDFYPGTGRVTKNDALVPLRERPTEALSFSIRFGRPVVTADLVDRRVTATYEAVLEPDHEGEFGGRKLSTGDAKALLPVLRFERNGAKRFPRGPDRARSVGVTFNEDERFAVRDPAVPFGETVVYALVSGAGR